MTSDSQHDSKIGFLTEKEARAAATVAKYHHGSSELKVYKCRRCDLWHLASSGYDE